MLVRPRAVCRKCCRGKVQVLRENFVGDLRERGRVNIRELAGMQKEIAGWVLGIYKLWLAESDHPMSSVTEWATRKSSAARVT